MVIAKQNVCILQGESGKWLSHGSFDYASKRFDGSLICLMLLRTCPLLLAIVPKWDMFATGAIKTGKKEADNF